MKRVLDVVVAGAGLVLLLPLMTGVALGVRLTSPGPVFYLAERVGRHGRPFRMVKFRSMVAGADHTGPLVTAGGDPRVTPIGRVLRRTKIDELPSLWNVLRGEMSLVGPRPENPRDAARYTPEQRRVLSVRPGITSLATIAYRHEEELLMGTPDLDARYHEIMQQKLALDLQYVDRRSLGLDCAILARTLLALFR